ncbi:DUF4267 domain-containing protein [Gordonia sp. DT30]|uniref:DUF4267 domain-containing protein n=1 Tax=unclassified Gordonia (in: high G+C Gram-positive bacteria) TaxID=2657482 RepID=UPI003CEF511A
MSILWWTGLVIGWALALGIIAIGGAYLARNAANAAGFGLTVTVPPEARAWWQVKGIRDLTTGVLVIAFTFAGTDRLPLLLGVLAIVPIGDMLIVLGQRGNTARALGIHGLTALLLLLAAVLMGIGHAAW